jgi:hypothetical protein
LNIVNPNPAALMDRFQFLVHRHEDDPAELNSPLKNAGSRIHM